MNETELYLKALALFGEKAQVDLCIEEMAELTKALLKYRREPSETHRIQIAEELKDVQITVSQMQLQYSTVEEQLYYNYHKHERLDRRVRNWEDGQKAAKKWKQ